MNKTYSFLLALVLGCMSASAGATLVVGNYNLRYRTLIDGEKYWDYRADNVAQTIRDGAFDVLSLDEMNDDRRHDGRSMWQDMKKFFPEPEYDFVTAYCKPGDEENGMQAILYKTTVVEVLDQGHFWLGPDPNAYHSSVWDHGSFGRMSLWAKFKGKATGEIFYYMSTHLHHQGDISKNEGSAQNIDMMRRIAGNYPAFISGDHNCATSRKPFYDLHCAYFDDSRAVAAKTDGSNGTCNVWRNGSLTRLDYIWVKGASVSEYSTIQNKYDKDFYPSDHFPVRAVVTLDAPTETRLRYVDASAADGGDGSLAAPFNNLQDGIDASGRGDTLLVAKGTYVPTFKPSGKNVKETFYIERSLTLIGGYNSGFTAVEGRSLLSGDLDGDEAPTENDVYNVVTVTKTAALELANFEITGACAKAQKGAGIQCNGPRLILDNVYVHDNKSNSAGPGVYAYGQIKATNCIFERNVTSGGGGAIACDTNGSAMPWSHLISGCRFSENKALIGSAVYVQSTMWLSIINNSFDNNVCTARGTVAVTGNKTYSTVTIANNTFTGNRLETANTSGNATKGGSAIFIQDMKDNTADGNPKAAVSITSNTIVGNRCNYVKGAEVPADFNAAAINVLKAVDLYINSNIIAGNTSDGPMADIYLTEPSAFDPATSNFNIYSHRGSINIAHNATGHCASSASSAVSLLADALDGQIVDGRFIAKLSPTDGCTKVVRIHNPTFGDVALNSLLASRFIETNTRADFNGDCQIDDHLALIDQRGARRPSDGTASYGACEYIPGESGVETVSVATAEGPVVYYDLRGIEVSPENIAPGIYIRRQGKSASKIIIR